MAGAASRPATCSASAAPSLRASRVATRSPRSSNSPTTSSTTAGGRRRLAELPRRADRRLSSVRSRRARSCRASPPSAYRPPEVARSRAARLTAPTTVNTMVRPQGPSARLITIASRSSGGALRRAEEASGRSRRGRSARSLHGHNVRRRRGLSTRRARSHPFASGRRIKSCTRASRARGSREYAVVVAKVVVVVELSSVCVLWVCTR